MKKTEKKLIERSINDIMAEDGDFHRGVHTLCTLVGWKYPAYETIKTITEERKVTPFGLELVPGMQVRTVKGCRIAGNPGTLIIRKIGLQHSGFDAALCEKENGDKRVFLIKNLRAI